MAPKNILITGANRGIGLEFVKQLLQLNPVNLIATCRSWSNAKELLELAKTEDALTVIRLDVDDEKSLKEARQQTENILGNDGLNVLINNAAIYLKCSSVQDICADEMIQSYRSNVVGPALMCREFLPLLKPSSADEDNVHSSWENAAIVNISTNLGAVAEQNYADHYNYDPTKAALNMFTKTLSIELKTLGILVVAMHPGWVKTDMGGCKAPVSTQESVSGMLKVLPTLTKYNTGRLFEYTGREMPW